MKKTVLAASFALSLTIPTYADTLAGIYIGGQIWQNEASGEFGESGEQANFNFSDEQQGSFYVAFEHPLPFIPNAKIASTSLSTEGFTTLDREISFDNKTFAMGSEVNANFDVSYIDYTLYYELFDNGLFSFDLGITGRDFDGDVSLSARSNIAPAGQEPTYINVSGTIATDEIVPMLYASTIVGLPFTGFNVFAEGNFLSIDDHTLYDYQVGVSYEVIDNPVVDLNLTAGYRSVKLELEDLNDLYTNIDFQGIFVGAIVHF